MSSKRSYDHGFDPRGGGRVGGEGGGGGRGGSLKRPRRTAADPQVRLRGLTLLVGSLVEVIHTGTR